MVKTALVELEINEGRKLLELFGAHAVPFEAAFWRISEDPGSSRLVLVTSLIDEIGERKTLRRLLDILTESPDRTKVELEDLTIVSPKSRFGKAIRRKFRSLHDQYFEGLRIGDERIADAYLYFAR